MSDIWDRHYHGGGRVFKGSTGKYRVFKQEHIKKHITEFNDILDVGCGDLTFWKGIELTDYTGVDSSPAIIKRNTKEHPEHTFHMWDATEYNIDFVRGKVFCLDVLFHIEDDEDYYSIVDNICNWSTDWLIIYSSYLMKPSRNMIYGRWTRSHEELCGIVYNHGFESVATYRPPFHWGALFVFRRKKD